MMFRLGVSSEKYIEIFKYIIEPIPFPAGFNAYTALKAVFF